MYLTPSRCDDNRNGGSTDKWPMIVKNCKFTHLKTAVVKHGRGFFNGTQKYNKSVCVHTDVQIYRRMVSGIYRLFVRLRGCIRDWLSMYVCRT